MKKSLFALLALLLCVAMFFTSCATKPEVVTPVTPVEPGTTEPITPEQIEPVLPAEPEFVPATLTKTDSRMLWRIDGTDKNGNPSVVYVLGTFHFATDEIYPLSDEIVDAWNSADRLVAEISSDDQIRFTNEILPAMLEESQKLAVGRNVIDELSPDNRLFFYNSFTPEQRDLFNSFEPWYLGLSCSSGIVMAMGMDPQSGIDNVLFEMAQDAGRPIEGLDPIEVQVNILRFGDWDEQLVVAEQSVAELVNIEKTYENILSLYMAYVDDEPEVIEALVDGEEQEELGEDVDPVLIRYANTVYAERNEAWSEKIRDYIIEGGTTFVYGGSAHWCSQNSVFNIMKEKNYIK
jgi:uncharacterized protein YbaP (TraB family)